MCAALGNVVALILICAALPCANLPGGRALPAATLRSVPASPRFQRAHRSDGRTQRAGPRSCQQMRRGVPARWLLPAPALVGIPKAVGSSMGVPSPAGGMGWFAPPASLAEAFGTLGFG